jgi:hypothetical protein
MTVQLFKPSKQMPPARFERKYYLPLAKVDFAYGLLSQICIPDAGFASEQINSLYFDTDDLDQYERTASGDNYKDKVRIRWYGEDKHLRETETVFIELKSKQAFASNKQRLKLQVPSGNLVIGKIRNGIIPRSILMNTLASFGYFPFEILQPVIKISYWRYRFTEVITGQRVSLDCHIRSTMVFPGLGNGHRELELPGAVIEVKGRSMGMPVTLMQAKILDTDWTRFSKYSACIDSHIEASGSVGWLSPPGRVINQ